MPSTTEVKFGPLTAATTLTGAGLGGILDISLFHQTLQLHHMLSGKLGTETVLRLKMNLFWDGIFLLLALAAVVFGLCTLWKTIENPYTPRSTRVFYGGLIMGTGLFFTLEGIINHLLLEIHHVIENTNDDQKFIWDVVMIISGVVIAWVGKFLTSNGKKKFYNREIQKSRRRRFDFRPAFKRRRTALRSGLANMHRHTRASNSYR